MSPLSQMTIFSVAAGLSVFVVCLYLYSVYTDYAASRAGVIATPQTADSALFRLLRPFYRFLSHLIGRGMVRMQGRYGNSGLSGHLFRIRLALQRTLTGAGSPEGITADEFLGLCWLSLLFWAGLGLLALAGTGWSFPLFAAIVVGLAHPHLWLRRTVSRRREQIRKLLPFALDLLTLSVEAGLDFTAALARLAPKLEGSALAEEFGELLRQVRLGKSRSEALRDMSDRVNMTEVTSFASSLIQAEELGADLGPVLRVQSDQMRQERSNRAEKKAMEAPVKILFPLIAFIFPTVFIILFSPIGIKYLRHLFGY